VKPIEKLGNKFIAVSKISVHADLEPSILSFKSSSAPMFDGTDCFCSGGEEEEEEEEEGEAGGGEEEEEGGGGEEGDSLESMNIDETMSITAWLLPLQPSR
jgi:hypothetical protein